MTVLTAQDALARVPDWADGSTSVLEPLGGGSDTNAAWLVERRGLRYVLRIDTSRAARLGLDRQREATIREQVGEANLAPAVVFCDPVAGVLLSEYKAGRAWTADDLHDERNLRLLADHLRSLHSLPVLGAPVSLREVLMMYAAELGDSASLALARQAVDQLEQVATYRPALCHNDLVAENLIAGDRLWLIDWEYAGVGNPLFDLAVVIEHHGLPPALWRPFVARCLGRDSGGQEADLQRYRTVYRKLAALWQAVQ